MDEQPTTTAGKQGPATLIAIVATVLALMVGGAAGYFLGSDSRSSNTSRTGQIAYACDLAKHLHTQYGSPTAWYGSPTSWNGDLLGSNRLLEAAAVGALLGGFSGGAKDHPRLVEMGEEIAVAVSRADLGALESALNSVRSYCQ